MGLKEVRDLTVSDGVDLATGTWTGTSSGSASFTGSGKYCSAVGTDLSNRGAGYMACTIVKRKKYEFGFRCVAGITNSKIGADSNDGTDDVRDAVGNNPDLAYINSADSTVVAGRKYRDVFINASTTTADLYFQGINGTVTADEIFLRLVDNSDKWRSNNEFPSVGVDEGVTFNGDTKINSQGVMYFPTGDTSQRGRGRGLFMGGYAPSQYRTEIDYIQIQSQGNAIDFGVLSGTGPGEGADCASSTRAIQGGGSLVNTMEYVTIATTSNTTDFGDLTVARRSLQSLSNETRGTWAGGTTNPAMSDVIDYVTIATTGNATDFGNLSVGRRNLAQAASPTRGVWAGGNPGSGPLLDDTIDYITIASAGNATDFGNLSAAYREMSGCSSGIRGVFGGGSPGPTQINTMEYITIATAGNVTDFGDLFYAQASGGGTSNGTRGIFAGGSGAAYTNAIQYITISTTGNAKDFGDLTLARILYSATSDSHGGISE